MNNEYEGLSQLQQLAYDRGAPDEFVDWRATHPDIVLDAIDVAEEFMRGRLKNDQNQAQAYRLQNGYLEDSYESYKIEWEEING